MFTKCYKEYCNFLTRASRSEYWIYTIIMSLINSILLAIAISIFVILIKNGTINNNMSEEAFVRFFFTSPYLLVYIVLSLISSIITCPWYAVAVRRLHDIGYNAWWLLISCIPIIGGIWFLVLTLLPGQKEDNQWGANPHNVPSENIDQISKCGYCFKKAFAKTFDYSSTSPIEEYYGFGFVFSILITIFFIIATIISYFVNLSAELWPVYYCFIFMLVGLWILETLLQSIPLMVRRLRDAGFSPYLALLLLLNWNIVTYILMVFCSQPTKQAEETKTPPSYDQNI
ncbi:MAG: DUF805 domain-containing protein [Abditibacteriota bacterium]|nr:DUF805 domain-containing protein [Abditibacteriota bacterium]